MKQFLRKGITASIFAAAAAMSGSALALPITISAASFVNIGGGYGQEAGNVETGSSPTLLDVGFSTVGYTGTLLNLSAGQTSSLFNFGQVTFNESNAGGGIRSSETDNLGVEAQFTFNQPGVGSQTVTAVGIATVGAVNDPGLPNAVDYTINWAPLLVNFGNGGSFTINLTDLSFSAVGAQQAATATITLNAEGRAVPEPSSLALAGLGLLAFGSLRRHRQR